MLQPVTLRGAGGHSRQWAEPCWKLPLPPCSSPTLPLPFIVPTILFLQKHSSFLTSIYFSIRSCLLSSISLPPSIHPSIRPSACPHRLRHPTRLTSNRCATVVLLLKLCCSCSIFTHGTLSEVKKSQRFVYIWVGEKKLEVSPSRESKADWYTGHQSDWQMSWSQLNKEVDNQWCPNTMQSVFKPKHQILPPRSHYVYWLSHNPWTD